MNTRDNHTTADVDGARTFVRTSTLTNKPDSYGVADILGTGSMCLHKDTNKPDRQLYHDDIEGSKPRNKFLFRTKRCVNPLEPEYTLPSFVVDPTVAPKFTRDSYDVSDIEGTKSKPLYPLVQRHNHLVDDIEGAQSGWKPRHQRARHESAPLDHCLNVSDITGGGFRTRRVTNPLTPSYRVNGMDVADDPVKTRPRGLPKAKDGPFYPLTTADIEGAAPGWRPLPQVNPPIEARRHFRNTNFLGDVPGAQADTVKHSICTERHINPLNPVYASLDGEPLANPQTPLYKEPACVEAEAQLDKSIAAAEAGAAAPASAVASAGPSPTTSNGQAAARISNHDEESRQQASPSQHSPQRQQAWDASIKRRPSSEPPRSAGTGVGGSGGDGSGGGMLGGGRARTSDSDKDERIRRLESEIRLLRKEDEEPSEKGESAPGTGVLAAPNSGNTINSFRRTKGVGGGSGGSGGRSSSRSWPGTGRKSLGGGGRGAMVIQSRGNHGSQQSERLVLRSANGTPRVPLTPSERRSAREYIDDVSSVRDLQ
eukprot:g12724.t1